MELSAVTASRRTIRFYQQRPVEREKLTAMLESARQSSCAANLQRLRYQVIEEPSLAEKVFRETAWAARVQPRRTPVWGKNAAPVFIAVTGPAGAGSCLEADAGAAIQSMELTAWNLGLGCCWLGAIQRRNLAEILGLDSAVQVLFLLAVGYPAETPVSEDADSEDRAAYYLDSEDRLHVPKLTLENLVRWR